MSTSITYRPKYPLNQFIDVIWIGKAENIDLQAENHAALYTELIFNYGDEFNVQGKNIESVYNKSDHHIISGLKTEPFHTKVSGIYANVGLLLKPFCYGMLYRKFGTQAMEQISEILYEHLYVPITPNFEAVEKQLFQIFDTEAIDADLLQFEKYISTNILEKGSLKDFNLSISISQKSFIKKFKKQYLLTPGEYIKLKQVNNAIKLLQNNNAEKLINIGLDSGFYDQSHFIRVFKKFCGVTPKQFIKRITEE
ncbi:AraC family transcriptional regulator [Puteibacter caeruleilacunae]|nr:AraC family transcriptional regulator [Puteibacter caeruleilacunae]